MGAADPQPTRSLVHHQPARPQDRPWNVLALVNGVFGAAYSHSPSALSSPIDVPAENIRVTTNEKEATTTTYLVPPPTLPMLRPFSRVAARVANADNNVLKPIVDRGYSRYDAGNGNRMPHLKPPMAFHSWSSRRG